VVSERSDWSKDSDEPHRNDRLRVCFEVWFVSKSASLSATDCLRASAWTLRQLVCLSNARFLTVVLALSCSCALAQQKVGYVLEMEGTWTLRANSQPLSMGQALPRAGLLVNSNPLDNDYIVVANLRGEVIKTIRCRSGVCGECRESGGCYDPIQPLPDAGGGTSAFSATLDAVLELFTGKPDRFSIHRVRGIGFSITRDGIARLDGTTVDVRYFLDGQEKASYELWFAASPGEAQSKKEWKSSPIALNWKPGEAAAVVVNGIQPGLYEMRVRHSGEVSSAWVLLCAPAMCSLMTTSFEEFLHRTNAWGDSVTSDTKRCYQRAYLEYLSSGSFGSSSDE